MKHLLTLFLALVLGTSSFSQFIFVSPLVYDSFPAPQGYELLIAEATFQSNTVYYATLYFKWSTDREELENGGGHLIYDEPRYITPGVISRTEQYRLYWWEYQELAPIGTPIYFKIHIDVYDEENGTGPIEVYDTSVRTWRFQTIFTSVGEESFSEASLYPNPTNTEFVVPTKVTELGVRMVSIDGKSFSLPITSGKVAVGSLAPGLYTVFDADQKFIGRITVSG